MTGRELIDKYKALLEEAQDVEITDEEQEELLELGALGQYPKVVEAPVG